MEKSDDLKNLKWAVLTGIVMFVDIYLLSVAMQTIGAGLSYAVWTGIGAVSTFIMGIFVYKESATLLRMLFIFIIIAGIVGLNITAGGA